MNCHRISEFVAPPRHSGQRQRAKVTSSGTHLKLPRLLGTLTGPQVLAQVSFFTPYSPAQIPDPHTHYTGLCPTRWSSLKFTIEYICMTGLRKTHVPLPPSAWKGTYSPAAAACAQRLTPFPHRSWFSGHSSLPPPDTGRWDPLPWEWLPLRIAPSLQQVTPYPLPHSSHQQLALQPCSTHIQVERVKLSRQNKHLLRGCKRRQSVSLGQKGQTEKCTNMPSFTASLFYTPFCLPLLCLSLLLFSFQLRVWDPPGLKPYQNQRPG